MASKISKIPEEDLKEIFPRELSRGRLPDRVHAQLKEMILSGKLKRGQKLTYDSIALDFDVSREVAHRVISQLKKDGLVISKGGVGSSIV